MNALLPPPHAILKQFHVELVAPLRGRLNHHWRVQRGRHHFVLRRWSAEGAATLDYELRLLCCLDKEGWPVVVPIEEPREWDGAVWSLAHFLPGSPDAEPNSPHEQRRRGRLLAELHATTAQFSELGQRGTWRRGEQVLSDAALDETFAQGEAHHLDEMRLVRWHLDQARARMADLELVESSSVIVHGDFAPWNLLFAEGQLMGVLDFELAHRAHRVSDFSLAWRGKYDEVVFGYDEVAPLAPDEWTLITPLWWAVLLEQLSESLRRGHGVDEWSFAKLRQRSPLMHNTPGG